MYYYICICIGNKYKEQLYLCDFPTIENLISNKKKYIYIDHTNLIFRI